MRRGKRRLIFAAMFLTVAVFIVTYVVVNYVIPHQAPPPVAELIPTPEPKISVAVANQAIQAYSVLGPNNLTTQEIPVNEATADMQPAQALYGRITMVPLATGQRILTSVTSQAGFSSVLQTGERAYTLPVPEADTFGGTILPGDSVDIVWTGRIASRSDSGNAGARADSEMVTVKSILTDVHVIRVVGLATTDGSTSQNAPAPAPPAPVKSNNLIGSNDPTPIPTPQGAAQLSQIGAVAGGLYSDSAPYSTVLILALRNDQVEALQFARETGKITLSLRSSAIYTDGDHTVEGDHGGSITDGLTLEEFMQRYGIPQPRQ